MTTGVVVSTASSLSTEVTSENNIPKAPEDEDKHIVPLNN